MGFQSRTRPRVSWGLSDFGVIRAAAGVMASAVLSVAVAGCGSSINDTASLGGGMAPQATSAAFAPVQDGGGVSAAPAVGGTAAIQPVATRIQGAENLVASATPGSDAYKIGPQDVLEISVFKVPDLSRAIQVADAGTINLPLVGEVEAAGRTARDLERDLTQKLGDKYLQSPQVTVFVKEYNSRRVTIEGAVKKPGVYPIRGRTTLLQFVSIAEGVTEAADEDKVIVFRQANGQRSAARFDLGEIRGGKAEDPQIQDGDVIVVNTSAVKAAFQNLLRILPSSAAFVPLI